MNFRDVNKSVDVARVLFKINIIYLPQCARLYKLLYYILINDFDDNNYHIRLYTLFQY